MTITSPPLAGLPPTRRSAAAPSPLATTSFVKVPHCLIDDPRISDHALLVWVLLTEIAHGGTGYFLASYANLQIRSGWHAAGTSRTCMDRRTHQALRQLEAIGVLHRRRRHVSYDQTRPEYKLAPLTGGYEMVPREVLRTITDVTAQGQASALLAHYCAYHRVLAKPTKKRGLITTLAAPVSVARIASLTRAGRDKTRTIRNTLIELGVLFTQQLAGRAPQLALVPFTEVHTPHARTQEENVTSNRSSTPNRGDVDDRIDAQDGVQEPGDDVLEIVAMGASESLEPLLDSSGDPYWILPVTPTGIFRSSRELELGLETLLEAHVGPQGRDSELTHETAAPATPPSENLRHDAPAAGPAAIKPVVGEPTARKGDWADRTAGSILAGIPELSGWRMGMARGMCRQRLAAKLRTRPDRDLIQTRRDLAAGFANAAALDELHGSEVAVLNQALAIWETDQLVAPIADVDQVEWEPPAPTGPTIDDLAAHPLPDIVDDHSRIEARTIEVCRHAQNILRQDPDADIDDVIRQALTPAERTTPGSAVRIFAAARVRTAHHQWTLQRAHDEWREITTATPDPQILALAQASIEQASTTAVA